ncbi:response regulator transcription factor [Veronia pacifica]|uniref:DNA-binding response regulator n=1 Tax=Veronia pacifica TaxID=1080227 RepID=A0A1C3EKX1_9GAMM|nr:response regulator transcription factor [Veronia pacifica]ODA33888.1 DNA-binding response regulator [Veronia pacifica]
MTKIRIMLVDDHQMVLDGFSARFHLEESIDVVAKANNGLDAYRIAAEKRPDVVLMDISMPALNGVEATAMLNRNYPDIRILMLSMHDNREYIKSAINAGASGYVLKEVPLDEMVEAIHSVHRGASYFCRTSSNTLFSNPNAFDFCEPKVEISQREKAVLALVAKGLSSKEMAKELQISARTIDAHRRNIKQKLQLKTTAEMITYALNNKIS